MTPPRVIVILGPTAGGKSDLAAALCERLDAVTGFPGEIIGADSMQVYRHLDAGTAKPSRELQEQVPHHLIDIVEPTERFTVRDWLTRADAAIAELQQRGRHPVVVGGTNLYLKALLQGLMDGPDHDPAFRATLAELPAAELHQRLQKNDPAAAERISPNDRQRLTRALEVFHLTGQPISAMQTQWGEGGSDAGSVSGSELPSSDLRLPTSHYRHDPLLLGLRWEPEDVNPRINLRVKAMFKPGSVEPALASAVCIGGESLPDEVRRLDANNLLGPQAREALGYKQTLAVLAPEKYPHLADPRLASLDDAMERTKVLTRRFAKQQRTWLKRFRDVQWVTMPSESPVAEALQLLAPHLTR